MPDETVEQLLNRLNDIYARMVNDPGEVMKTQVIKGICNKIAAFAVVYCVGRILHMILLFPFNIMACTA